MPTAENASWGQRLMGELPQAAPAHASPRRVMDGLLSESLRRRLWCVVHGSVPVTELAAVLTSHGKEVVVLGDDGSADQTGVGHAASVLEACDRYGASSADSVLVVGDPTADLGRFEAAGARVLIIGSEGFTRGRLSIPDPSALAALFDGATTYRTTSTYHEV